MANEHHCEMEIELLDRTWTMRGSHGAIEGGGSLSAPRRGGRRRGEDGDGHGDGQPGDTG